MAPSQNDEAEKHGRIWGFKQNPWNWRVTDWCIIIIIIIITIIIFLTAAQECVAI